MNTSFQFIYLLWFLFCLAFVFFITQISKFQYYQYSVLLDHIYMETWNLDIMWRRNQWKKLRKHATNLTIKTTVYTITFLLIKPKLTSKKKVRQELIIISSFIINALPIQVQKKTIAQNRRSTMRPNSLQLTKMFSAQISHNLR